MDEANHTIQLDNMAISSNTVKDEENYNDMASSKNDLIADEDHEGNVLSRSIVHIRSNVQKMFKDNSNVVRILFKSLIHISLITYLFTAILHWYNNGRGELDWCEGNGMIIIIYSLLAWIFIYYKLLKPMFFVYTKQSCISFNNCSESTSRILGIVKIIAVAVVFIGIIAFLIIDSVNSRLRLVSAGGVVVFIILGFIFSKYPNKVNWKTVIMGVLLQILFGLLVIRWEFGRKILMCVGNRVETFLRFGYKGAAFVYGDYLINTLGVFAFQSLSVIFFLSAVIEIFFYFGWMQIICFKFGWFIRIVMDTTIIESVNAVTTVFLGLSEAPLLYKPYIKDLTSSEMHAVMAGGFSTAAGTVFAAYAALGANPAYIITASIMAAPAALCFAKLLYPETEQSKTSVETFVPYKSEERNVVDAGCKGALGAINLVMGIIAIVIACISMVAFFDSTLVWFASIIGIEDFTFQYAVGKILIPIPYIMGVSPDQCEHVARLIGIKITLNEFIAYKELGKLKEAKLLTHRSEAMATFALCSFSNPGGLGSFIALLVGLCPSQKDIVTKVAIRALISGITTGLMTASIAGALIPEDGFGDCDSCATVSTLIANTTSFT